VSDSDLPLAASHVFPNPFRGSTEIAFVSATSSAGAIIIAAPDGRVVREVEIELQPAQRMVWRWDGRDAEGRGAPAGVYLYRLVSGGRVTSSGKLVLIR
jgi:flagellar hook assembly protein FlgD